MFTSYLQNVHHDSDWVWILSSSQHRKQTLGSSDCYTISIPGENSGGGGGRDISKSVSPSPSRCQTQAAKECCTKSIMAANRWRRHLLHMNKFQLLDAID